MIPMFAAIPWDPFIIGVLSTVISVLMLCGSVYLLLATNTGVRLGFLLAWTGFFAYMTLLGLTWWIYAIGLIGDQPVWEVEEVLQGEGVAFSETEVVRVLPVIAADDIASLPADADEWNLLTEDDSQRGEALAVANEALSEDPLLVSLFGQPAADDVVATAAFQTGGDRWPSIFGYDQKPIGWFGTPNHLVIQVQPTEPAAALDLNAAPPPREADLSQPVLSVVLTRDLGNVRFPPFIVTLASTIAFAVGVYLLHQRDKDLWKAQEEAAAA